MANNNWAQKSVENNVLGLDEKIEAVEFDAKDEEQSNALKNYSVLEEYKERVCRSIPYPEVGPYDTGYDYDDLAVIQQKKKRNEEYWKKENFIEKYLSKEGLYCGHVKTSSEDFFITEGYGVNSHEFKTSDKSFYIINIDDRGYDWAAQYWRYPGNSSTVKYSRNITLNGRIVTNVDIVLDRENSLFNKITDSYLRNALIRNKNSSNIQSIIQTIQEKQDNIRKYDKDQSFIVQGCAGSGKTMVLLHRLRYLLFNNDISNENYRFLVPSFRFKKYIQDITDEFKIRFDNILPYTEYYRICVGEKAQRNGEDISELVFGMKYLERVYSRQFMTECYKALFNNFSQQTNSLLKVCEEILNALLESETKLIESEIEQIKHDAFAKVLKDTEFLKDTEIGTVSAFEDIQNYISELAKYYDKKLTAYNELQKVESQILISPDDERLTSNEQLITIKKKIVDEEETLKKASIFTKDSHKAKLERIKSRYDEAYQDLMNKLIEEDKKKHFDQSANMIELFSGLSPNKFKQRISNIVSIYGQAKNSIKKEEEILSNINDTFAVKYAEEINYLTGFIEKSADIEVKANKIIAALSPAYDFIDEYSKPGRELYLSFYKHIKDQKERIKFKENHSMFSNVRSEQQQKAYMQSIIRGECKAKLNREYKISLCDSYKHTWYLKLYFHYLAYGHISTPVNYICIDEAQDLSPMEIELIYKINTSKGVAPIMNVFGDINQMISSHGVKNWKEISLISKYEILDENFRNPNQITDYCNKKLPFNMKKIGIDMDDVSEYKDFDEAVKKVPQKLATGTIVVKDEYYKKDLEYAMEEFSSADYKVFTVKEVKGFEFKEVFVIDCGMSVNEKYVAYTRALIKLYVISSIPKFADRNKSLIIQGSDEDSSDETDDESLS